MDTGKSILDEETVKKIREVVQKYSATKVGKVEYPCKEMAQLRNYLDYLGIDWEDNSSTGSLDVVVERTRFEIRGSLVSIIHGYGTYGGYDVYSQRDEGLLEIMTELYNNGEPEGSLSAEEVGTIVHNLLTEQ